MINVVEIIDKKRQNQALTNDEIKQVIDLYVEDQVPDYQMSALLMAMCCNGLNQDEINALTTSYINSGDVFDLSALTKPTVDKHSTGGVGDKTSLVISPVLAAFGVDVAKMSGRGLGFTGGTLDKLEAINGFNINLDEKAFINQVNNVGLSIISQTSNLVPADKKIYALRDVTATVDSIGLIAASIMSKKIAAGANHICLDVKCGAGAFMKDEASAKALAQTLINIGKEYDKKICAVISTMQQPLGISVGNSLEVLEAIDTLKGNGPKDLVDLSITIVKNLLALCQIDVSEEDIIAKLTSGEAYQKFIEFVEAQGGSKEAIDNLSISDKIYQYSADQAGYIDSYHTDMIGKAAQVLGAGRLVKTDSIDYSVGIKCPYKIGDPINIGDPLFTVYYQDENKLQQAIEYLDQSYRIKTTPVTVSPIILDVVR